MMHDVVIRRLRGACGRLRSITDLIHFPLAGASTMGSNGVLRSPGRFVHVITVLDDHAYHGPDSYHCALALLYLAIVNCSPTLARSMLVVTEFGCHAR
jgi:hypothetical protein